MGNMSGKSRFPIDAALILRDVTAPAVTVNTDLPYRSLVTKGAYWQNPADVQDGSIELVGKAGTFGGTGVSLVLALYTAEDATGTNAKLFASFPVDSGADFEIAIDEVGLLKRHAAASHFKVQLQVAGTNPSVPVFAYFSTRSPI